MSISSNFDFVCEQQKDYVAIPVMEERKYVIETELVSSFRQIIGSSSELSQYRVQGSNGIGNNAKVPWVRIFDPKQSPSATSGWYVVQLFAADGSASYLSLNLGVTKMTSAQIDEQVAIANSILASDISSRTDTVSEISLGDKNLGKLYERGNIAAFEYKPGNVFNDQSFSAQLKWLLSLLVKLPKQVVISEEAKVPVKINDGDELTVLENETGWSRDKLLPLIESLQDASPQIVLTGPPGTGRHTSPGPWLNTSFPTGKARIPIR